MSLAGFRVFGFVGASSYALRVCDGNTPAKPYLPLHTRTRHRRSRRHRIIKEATGNSAPHDESEEEESEAGAAVE